MSEGSEHRQPSGRRAGGYPAQLRIIKHALIKASSKHRCCAASIQEVPKTTSISHLRRPTSRRTQFFGVFSESLKCIREPCAVKGVCASCISLQNDQSIWANECRFAADATTKRHRASKSCYVYVRREHTDKHIGRMAACFGQRFVVIRILVCQMQGRCSHHSSAR